MVTAGTFLGRYRVESMIAAGGMGTVYAAVDERLNRPVAVKVLARWLVPDDEIVERFRREARAVAALSHPNVARVFDYGQDDDRHLIVMERVEGVDLARLLKKSGALDPDRAAAIASQICAALAHAHAAGIVHRDIKPANIMVSDTDHVKVTDFGIAHAAGDPRLTATGSVMGTAFYISPEQASGRDVTAATDIYSTGIVLYEMLTGSVPFDDDNVMTVAMRHATEDVPPPSNSAPGIPPELDGIVARATEKEPTARFFDAEAMARALEGSPGNEASFGPGDTLRQVAVDHTPPMGSQTVWPIPGTRWDPQRLGKVVLIAGVGLAIVAAVLLVARERPSSEQRRTQAGAPATTEGSPAAAQPSFLMPAEDEILGENPAALQGVFERYGYEVIIEPVDPGEFDVEAPEGVLVYTEPAPGTTVMPGDTITLFVSAGSGRDEAFIPPGLARKGRGND